MAEHKDSSNYYFRSAARGNVVTDRTAQRGRAAILGAGALASAAAALGGAQLVAGPEEKERPLLEKICLSSDVPLVEGLSEGCYDRDVFLAFRERPVLRGEGSPITVTLADPKDDLAPLAVVKTCIGYDEKIEKSWFALSNREMRRQAYFVRACGVLDSLLAAVEPEVTYFAGRALSVDEAQSIVEGPPFRMVEAPTISDGIETRADGVVDDGVVDGGSVGKGALSGEGVVADDEAAALIDKAQDPVPTTMLSDGPGLWRMDMEDQTARLQEIAHADFDNDGVGDILAFVAIGVKGGTARFGQVGLLQKKSPTAPVRFKTFRKERAPVAG